MDLASSEKSAAARPSGSQGIGRRKHELLVEPHTDLIPEETAKRVSKDGPMQCRPPQQSFRRGRGPPPQDEV